MIILVSEYPRMVVSNILLITMGCSFGVFQTDEGSASLKGCYLWKVTLQMAKWIGLLNKWLVVANKTLLARKAITDVASSYSRLIVGTTCGFLGSLIIKKDG
ncbi:hypothetical protein C5167_036269 [Papaver somniferum]|nr:hypothetical protein C5167_036269 [Papaver somniferum]